MVLVVNLVVLTASHWLAVLVVCGGGMIAVTSFGTGGFGFGGKFGGRFNSKFGGGGFRY